MSVCVYVCETVCMFMSLCVHIHMSLYVCQGIYMCVCVCEHLCVYEHLWMYLCVCLSLCVCVCVCVCVCAPTPTPPVLCTGPSECCYGKSSLLDTCHTLAKATRKSWSSSPVEDGWTHLRTARGRCMTEDFLQLLSTIFLFKKYLKPHMLFNF